MSATRLSDYSSLIFHIGLHKTGTSSLQAMLRANAGLLRGAGIHYPEYHDPARAARANGNHSSAVQGSPGQATLWDGLAETLDLSSDCETLLISAEDYARPVQLAKLTDRLRVEAPDMPVRFIVYLRRYDQLLESAYAQSVRGQYWGPITDCGYNMEFRAILQHILDLPGRVSMAVRPYNRQLWPEGALGRDFLETLGLGALWGLMQVDPSTLVNPSLPRVQTHILSCLTSPQATRAMLDYFILKPPQIADGPGRYFYSPSERLQINRQFLDGDRALLNALGIADPEAFLDSENFPDAAEWTPFHPDHAAISAYLAEFIDWRLSPKAPLATG